jgi:SNF2 family DNA or RNA helicase
MKNGANFSVPGAGKTTTALVVWDQLKKKGLVEKILVISPRSAFEAWQFEPSEVFQKAPETQIFDEDPISENTDILVTNYEKLESPERLSRLQLWMQKSKVLLIIDEAHRIKGGNFSVRYRGAKELVRFAARTDILTGTPLPQGLDDLRNLLHLSWKTIPVSYFSDSRLRSLKRGGIFVRTTKAELGLPPVSIREVALPMGEMQSQIYSALGKNYVGQFAMSTRDENYLRGRGKAVFTLLAVSSNPGLLLNRVNEGAYLDVAWPPREVIGDENLLALVNDYVQYEIPPKYVWLQNLLKNRSEQKQKVLIWSNFVGNLKALEKVLAPFNPVLIYGGTPPEERSLLLKKFREDRECLVLLSNPQTLGEGVSLHQVCHEAVYVDRSYNAGHYLQSVDRIHRLGLSPKQNTEIHFLVSERSIDERVKNRLAVKIQRLASILDDTGLVSGTIPNTEEDKELRISDLDFADLSDLFDHLRRF